MSTMLSLGIVALLRHLPLALGLVILGGLPPSASAQRLSSDVARLLDATPFDRNHWGLVVLDSAGRILASRHPEQFFMPASNTKLLVSAAAAVLFPPGFRVRTSVYGGGEIVDGVLTGDLVLYGRGDPTLSRRCYAGDTTRAGVCDRDAEAPLRALVRQLRSRGVTTVAGDLVGDGSWFEPTMIHPTWEVDDLTWWYAAPVSGLGVHDNAVALIHAGGERLGDPALVRMDPAVAGVTLDNRTRTVADTEPQTVDYRRELGSMQVVAVGTVRRSTRPTTQYVALPDPNYFTAAVFRRLLAEEGITILGATRTTTDSVRHQPARHQLPLAEVESRPVEDWIYPVLNSSQNWFAEMLLKQLGRHMSGEGSWRAGIQSVRRFLIDSVGIDSTQVRAVDGSGLSAQNLVTPMTLARLLWWMRGHPRYEAFAAGMPRSGERGSLRTRFVGTPLEGLVRAKTGTITGVNSLSGYIDRAGRPPLIFSLVANHHALSSAAVVRHIDSVVVRIGR